MEYPIWHLYEWGGGLLIALVATVHVFVSHFAVGGGLFLVLTERKAYRENSDQILGYAKSYTKFFLLLTMVFGGLTGVAIWFIISLLAPGPTSTLIHTFVFGWATEWVCFVGEIVALIIYYYSWGRIDRQKHMTLGWLYFIFAWLSLFLITGIIDFMLTPGNWLQSGSFWDGFFNVAFWPSVFFRTGLALMMAGVFGFVAASFIKDETTRQSMFRYTAWWASLPLVLVLLSGWWYLGSMPPAQKAMILAKSYELKPYFNAFIYLGPAVAVLGLIMALKMPKALQRILPFAFLILGFSLIGSFEYTREAARRPYLIHGHTYSTGVKVADVEKINQNGYLKTAKWIQNKDLTEENKLAAGEELFFHQCSVCHSISGALKDIKPRTVKFTAYGMDAFLNGMGKINEYMPPFVGTRAEREALAAFIVGKLHGKPLQEKVAPDDPTQKYEMPPFDRDKDEYVLLSWNNLGMHCISDAYKYWVLLPPANDLYAQLIKRGDKPQVVTKDVVLTFKVQPEFENPAERSLFWQYEDKIFGVQLKENIGLSGLGVSGEMKLSEHGWYEAALIPVEPYPKGGGFNPFPLFTIEAKDKNTGQVLATTKVVAPTSTEMGCRNCHGGEWRVAGKAGISDEAGADVLRVHDRMSGTNLLAQAEAGNPKLCQSCHPDPVLGAKGNPELLNLPAALHGLHANYLTGRGSEACTACHPNAPSGPTRCLRGVHGQRGVGCARCHGFLEDHALSLLKKEHEAGKKGAARLMKNLNPRTVATLEAVNGRTPWLGEPDCLNCHVDFKRPDKDKSNGYNIWTKGPGELYRMKLDDNRQVACAACHNSPHATYPTVNAYGKDRDNIQPLQYQGLADSIGRNGNCNICHLTPPSPQGRPHHKGLVATQAQ